MWVTWAWLPSSRLDAHSWSSWTGDGCVASTSLCSFALRAHRLGMTMVLWICLLKKIISTLIMIQTAERSRIKWAMRWNYFQKQLRCCWNIFVQCYEVTFKILKGNGKTLSANEVCLWKLEVAWNFFGKYTSTVVVRPLPSEKIYQIRLNGSSAKDTYLSERPIFFQCLFTRNEKETFSNRKTWRSKSPNSHKIISSVNKVGINSNAIEE